ncbi:MAG: hypothetical protein COU35_00730 [Candidatus Magasanikbacteria bacterium CG10_big_fil_rev_8_21_14_0_10_47_10]|uniref:ABM domain-containing protein n=1 Tax=Candidatus Magasanikbacteria bacterium CG10_big_fil_rev_8_21_14_0_10_47_10 TaxID=1974652 RepID=A0A2H0TTP9_9BACT|nr:MAG: hypothetical protein COU35_00730 [Candidatus Magasanikbacteria bacterium CG10_big_fil_rev_8_21_14_0_10_47_10]
MPILAIFTGPISKDGYESLRKEVDWEHQQPAGGIMHVASFDNDDGIHVADVWESGDLMNQFVNERLMPAMKKLNLPAPKVEVYPTYNINAYSAIDQYKL